MHEMLMEMQLQMLIAATVKDSSSSPVFGLQSSVFGIPAPRRTRGLKRRRRRKPREDDSSSQLRLQINEATSEGAHAQHRRFRLDWIGGPNPHPTGARWLMALSLALAHSYANLSTLVTTNEMPTRRNAKRASNCKLWDASVDKVAPE